MQNRLLVIVICIIVALVIIGIAFYQYLTTGLPEKEIPIEEVPTLPTQDPKEVVSEFYTWYTSDHLLPKEDYKDSPLLSDAFKTRVGEKTLDEREGIDPLLCANGAPESFIARTVKVAERSQVVIDSTLSDVEAISFIVELIPSDNTWMIDDVVCFAKG